jgi:imidazole glycerol-phosphate synthase subunit HisH
VSRVVVLDYGSGNLRSAERALARTGASVRVTSDLLSALSCDGLVVPGVGAFAACMTGLHSVGGDKLIAERVSLGRPVLGICVGMQVLFASGVEHGVKCDGCGVWPGVVSLLETGSLPLPHMGWNTVSFAPGSTLFAGVPADTRFYFVHSYAAFAAPGLVSWTSHGSRFAAAVEDGVVSATQFHPEKSGDAGFAVLSNWVRSLS